MADRLHELMEKHSEIIGQKPTYDETIPDLMRYENFDAEYLASHDAHFQQLDAMPHLERAALGAEEWNAWVQWAQLTDDRWMDIVFINSHTCVRLKETSSGEHSIDFSLLQKRLEDYSYRIDLQNCENFVFPAPISFRSAIFTDTVSFKDAIFVSGTGFTSVEFEQKAYFVRTIFQADGHFKGAKFAGFADFRNAIFHNRATFSSATFYATVYFIQSIFHDYTDFSGASFLGFMDVSSAVFEERFGTVTAVYFQGTRWNNCTFKKFVDFRSVQFLETARFQGSCFKEYADFDHVWFGKAEKTPKPDQYEKWDAELQQAYDAAEVTPASETVPNFKGVIFAIPPNLGYTEVTEIPAPQSNLPFYQSIFVDRHLAWKTKDKDAGAKLRILGELAEKGHHNLAEKRFFRAELLARRGHEAKSWRENVMIDLFELFSECGLSFWKPLGWWAGLFVSMMLIYGYFSNSFGTGNFPADIGHLFNYTLANSLPLIGVFKSSDTVAVQALFGGVAGIPFWSGFMAGVHNLISSIFLFFALLAIRNYFKLG